MRRSRFAKAIETSDTVTERASIRETLWFDIHGTESSEENRLPNGGWPGSTISPC